MLTNKQVKYLCKVSDLEPKIHNGIIYGVGSLNKDSKNIVIPYDVFVSEMDLEHPRLHWLLSHNGFMAGGAVLSWLLQDNQNNDIDFFFRNHDAAINFANFITQYDFVETNDTDYAKTFFNEEEGIILQVVGAGNAEYKKLTDGTQVSLFGTPQDVISTFDISVCQFALDCDNLYSNRNAISDLITRTLSVSDIGKKTTGFFNKLKSTFSADTKSPHIERILKYHRKGFFLPNPTGVSYDPNTNSW